MIAGAGGIFFDVGLSRWAEKHQKEIAKDEVMLLS